MATHSSVLAWRIPGTGEPGGLPSTGSHRVGHDWRDLAAAAAARFYGELLRNQDWKPQSPNCLVWVFNSSLQWFLCTLKSSQPQLDGVQPNQDIIGVRGDKRAAPQKPLPLAELPWKSIFVYMLGEGESKSFFFGREKFRKLGGCLECMHDVTSDWHSQVLPKNWCLQTMVLEKTPESPLDSKDIKPVNLKGNQPWVLTGKTDGEAEAPVFCSPDANTQLIGKDPDAGKYWGQEEKGVTGCDVWMASPTQWMSLSKLRKIVKNREAWRAAVPGVVKSWMWLSNWTTTICKIEIVFS